MAGKIVVPNAVKREKGYLYYISGSGDVCRTPMKRRAKKEAKK